MQSHVIIVANRLPFSIQEDSNGLSYQPSPGGMAAALGPVREQYEASWIGWTGLPRPLLQKERDDLVIPPFAHAVDIPTDSYHDYYYRVANGVLWPVLHGIAPKQPYTMDEWESNMAVNQQFATAIAAQAKPGDVIWIHDFHLIMLPALLRKAGVTNRISFFLHVPFADAALFKQLPHWREMLTSLQQVDFCGVQTPSDKKNLQGAYTIHDIKPPHIASVAIGIDYPAFSRAAAKEGAPFRTAIAERTQGKTVVLSISRLDYTKGILEQLKAIEQLHMHKHRPELLYKLIVSPSREALKEYRELKEQIDHLVQHINARFPEAVDYEYRTAGFGEVTAWYDHADIMVVTPLIDGMNLVAKEYIAARQNPGTLILSSTAGAAQQLTDALLVNPTNVDDIYAALQTALAMPPAERAHRWQRLRHNVQHEDVFGWAAGCLVTVASPGRNPSEH